MIPRTVASRFAHQAGVDVHLAQQEVVLLYALDLLREQRILERLVFKGGSYLRKILLGDAGRLSEDLDFTANGLPRDPGKIILAGLSRVHQGIKFGIREPHATSRGNWACEVVYAHEWDEGFFGLEISFRERIFLAPETRRPIRQAYFDALPFPPPEIPCMALAEALAEKLRALQQRTTQRDLYDVIQYARKNFGDDLVRLLAVAKLWNEHEPFEPERLLQILRTGRREWAELDMLVARSRRADWNERCRKAAERFSFLTRLSAFEAALIKDCRRHRLTLELRSHISSLS